MAQQLTRTERGASAPQRMADPFDMLRTEVDSLFDRFFGRSMLPLGGIWGNGGQMSLAPRVDVRETGKEFQIEAELPGLSEKDVEVSLKNGCVCISGEKSMEEKQEEQDFHLMERRYGKFQRMLRLPDSADEDKIEARFDKGVLKITVPKRAEAAQQAKKIEVKSTTG